MLSVYPSITSSEFAAACEALEKRCHDRLYGTSWRIVKWTRTELQIRQNRPLATNSSIATIRGDGPGGAHVGRDDETEAALDEVPDIEDCDEEMIIDDRRTSSDLTIDFSITLSPTYSVPVLWFTSPDLSSLEAINRAVIPAHLDESIRSVGVLGGISQAYHPVTDVPSFLVHPCNTHEALLAIHTGTNISPEQYLMLWFGIIGAAVGLHVPSRIFSSELTDT